MTKNKPKVEKKKKFKFRRFVRELKRVRWPSQKTNWISFLKVIAFTLLFTLIVMLFATLISLLWTKIGIN
ncbi:MULTISPECIES: preprotein translocase subunit SecE [unclassified Mycoplasma]|uniref:preprotein translocase subunit SecE n=1 Tax=unclassified Mycoplasma TaxID=2683645 RepID=UPI00216B46BC|nr:MULTISPECIES: preprotein translocase subunit SecE [unclassified Mycoplasma]MCS4536555.1 preprotein translocase subunit SecE [Mycoplasma sp. CSL7475-4]MCT4469626.1 preprotein translocase subunit SecE [Mycoplasma sp. HS2188]